MHHRVFDWRYRLHEYATRLLGRGFCWGETDCHALFVNSYAVLYGWPLPTPAWTSLREGARLYQSRWTPMKVLRDWAAPVEPITMVQAGDVIVEPVPEGEFFHPVMVALGRGRLLTSNVKDGVIITTVDQLQPHSQAWRWHDGEGR